MRDVKRENGPIVALALAAKDPNRDVVEQWRLLIGPKDVAIAREEAPESLRAQFSKGDDNYKNALHGSDSAETAARELAFFFPNFAKKRTGSAAKPTRVQRTLALIRPDALRKYKDDIISKIHAAGFEIANAKEVQLTTDQAAEFYKEHAEQDYFDKLVQHMSSGPVMALALCREDAVTNWREMLGPKNVEEAKDIAPDRYLRAQYVEKEDDPGLNALHGSDSLESAEREVNFFFPHQQTLAVIKPDTNEEEKEVIMNKIRSSGFHIAAQKETVLTKELAEQFYMEHKDKEFFGELTEFMTSGPTMFMVLSREDAICGMREIVGPADPEEAKKTAPDSIRAVVGKDKLKNAIHAPDDELKAMSAIKLAFGDELEFDQEGKVVEKPTGATPTDGEIEGSTHAAPAAEEGTTEAEVAAGDTTEVPGTTVNSNIAGLPAIAEEGDETASGEERKEGGETAGKEGTADGIMNVEKGKNDSMKNDDPAAEKDSVKTDEAIVTPEIAVMGESENEGVKQQAEDGTEKSTQGAVKTAETNEKSDKPAETDVKTADTDVKPADTDVKPAETDVKPAETPANEVPGSDQGTGENGTPTAAAGPGGMSEETRRMLAEIDEEAEIEARRSSLLPPADGGFNDKLSTPRAEISNLIDKTREMSDLLLQPPLPSNLSHFPFQKQHLQQLRHERAPTDGEIEGSTHAAPAAEEGTTEADVAVAGETTEEAAPAAAEA
eukprot:sb/3462502/